MYLLTARNCFIKAFGSNKNLKNLAFLCLVNFDRGAEEDIHDNILRATALLLLFVYLSHRRRYLLCPYL